MTGTKIHECKGVKLITGKTKWNARYSKSVTRCSVYKWHKNTKQIWVIFSKLLSIVMKGRPNTDMAHDSELLDLNGLA